MESILLNEEGVAQLVVDEDALSTLIANALRNDLEGTSKTRLLAELLLGASEAYVINCGGPGSGIPGPCPLPQMKGPKQSSAATADKAKFVGAKVGHEEQVHSGKVEHEIARIVGGEVASHEKGKYAPRDVQKDVHAIEVKAMAVGKKQNISVHDDSLLRKVNYIKTNPTHVYHTVAVDDRETYKEGVNKSNYSGNRLYYKRGSGRYALSQMHPVKDEAELKALIHTPHDKLPEKAKGRLPNRLEIVALRARAEKAHASRLLKDRTRKARIKAEEALSKTAEPSSKE